MMRNHLIGLRQVKAISLLLILVLALTIVQKASLNINTQENPTKKLPAFPPDEGAAKNKPTETRQARELNPSAQPQVEPDQPLVGPNLTPFRPTGWSDKIVVSNTPGNHTDSSPLAASDTLFIDWAVINNGTAATSARFNTKLFVDGVEKGLWFTNPPLDVNFFAFVEDVSIGSLSPGTHTLRIVADVFSEIPEGNELDNEYSKSVFISSAGQPNLTPFTPSGWSDKIVVSNGPGTHTDSLSLTANDTLFIDWAAINNGTAATSARFRTRLLLDGAERGLWFTDPPLNVNFFTFVEDFSIGSLSPGTHTLRIVIDVFSEIPESNEFDNEFSKFITVAAPGQPNLTPFTPSGWSDKIVVSNATGTHTDSSPLTTNDTLFIDWAVINNGAAATSARFNTRLFVDGVEKGLWFTDPPLNVNFFTFVEDFSIGTLSSGTHTLRIVADVLSEIPESNEFDNEFSKTISVTSQTCFTLTINVTPNDGGTTSRSPQSSCSASSVLIDEPNFIVQSTGPLPASVGPVPELSRIYNVNQAVSALMSKVEAGGSIRVIVGLQAPFEPEGNLSGPQAVASQREGISRAQDDLINRLPMLSAQSAKRFKTFPFVVMEVDAAGLRFLQSSPDVTSIEEDIATPPALAESTSIIGAPAAWASGHSGAGQVIAIIDSGVDKNHPFLAGKVVSEGCYSTTSNAGGVDSTSLCPGGAAQSTSPGSGLNCAIEGCDHGTHVAGIAAGRGSSFSGVARDANIIAIQVFSRFNNQAGCGDEPAPCVRTFVSDQVHGLDQVQVLASSFNIAAVNMSIGGGSKFTSTCDSASPTRTTAINSLRSRGIATIIAAGNEEYTNGLSAPACISFAISVGSTEDGSHFTTRDKVSSFSNSASFLNLLAPGDWITSSIPGGGFEGKPGTSMAAPHVAGAWAVLKSKAPSATIDQILSALTNTGVPVIDSRNGIVKPRIQIDAALNALGGGGGGGPAQYRSGTSVTLTASPNAGFTFVKWQRDGADFSTSPTVSMVVNANSTMTAVYKATTSNAPTISSASLQNPKTLRITGASFSQFPRVFINGLERSNFITTSSDSSITLKGKSKKLGLKTGDNNVQVVSASGTGSNVFVLRL